MVSVSVCQQLAAVKYLKEDALEAEKNYQHK